MHGDPRERRINWIGSRLLDILIWIGFYHILLLDGWDWAFDIWVASHWMSARCVEGYVLDIIKAAADSGRVRRRRSN